MLDRTRRGILSRGSSEKRNEPLAGGHLNMTKPALISQTNKRGPTITPLNRRGRMRITRPRQARWREGEGRNEGSFACFC